MSLGAGTIAKRIRQAAALAKRVEFVRQADWQRTLKQVNALDYKPEEVFIYLDPPFYERAERLYRHYFQAADHEALRNVTRDLRQWWLLSYDSAREIFDLYADHGTAPKKIDLLYSVNQTPVKAQEIIVTNLPVLPYERDCGDHRLSGGRPGRQTRNGSRLKRRPKLRFRQEVVLWQQEPRHLAAVSWQANC